MSKDNSLKRDEIVDNRDCSACHLFQVGGCMGWEDHPICPQKRKVHKKDKLTGKQSIEALVEVIR